MKPASKPLPRYHVGIDLGTTHTVLAYAEAGGGQIRLFEIEQLVAPGEVRALPLLPSLRYHPAPGELAPGETALPWPTPDLPDAAGNAPAQAPVIGQLARRLGAQVPGRLVASAKSWLSHAAVDRLAPILPWGAGADVARVSPVEASASYLAHVRRAWNARFPADPLEQQDIVLTVPASFDEGARALTLQAATDAGLRRVRLLEEPQAAFYDWLHRHRAVLSAELSHTRLVLVCDVGGGTTDFSLIRVDPSADSGVPQLTRIGVGKHLMLGGDNMDLVLARVLESRMNAGEPAAGAAGRLSASQLSQLIERCRAAKELLLAESGPASTPVTLLGAGSRMIGGARTAELSRADLEQLIVDGFFPAAAATELPQARRSGIVEFGLPYASDPAITRHLAAFLRQHADAAREALGIADAGTIPVPDTLLLNGGVFRANALAQRLVSTLNGWRGAPLTVLHNDNPDVAVARGAVAYSLARLGASPRIGGGSPRAYFLVLDEGAAQRRAVCLLPRGAEEGGETLLKDRLFALRVGQPVRFHVVSSTTDSVSQPGMLIDASRDDLQALPPIATVLKGEVKAEIPVQLSAGLTEIGTLDMHCLDPADPRRRWRLEFQLREAADQAAAADEVSLPPRFAEAIDRINRIFGARAQPVPPKEIRQLRIHLEKLLGAREQWDTPLLRRLFDALWKGARARKRSADHERIWLNLAGYCLRPGYGYPLDDWRVSQLWSIFESGIQYRNEAQAGSEWWTLWRRVAGGLDREAQLRLLDDFAFNVQADEEERRHRPPTLVGGNEDDMMRLAASLERIPADYKAEIGAWLLERIAGAPAGQAPEARVLWALGRVGARVPMYGSAHDVVPPEVAADWTHALLALDWRKTDAAAFAAAHIARMSADRSRDLPDDLRQTVIGRLLAIEAPAPWVAMVREVVQLDAANEQRIFGESLPPGLKLLR